MFKLLLVSLISISTFANTSIDNSFDEIMSEKNIPWSFEAGAIAQTIENASSPFVGATAIYNASERFEFGLRAMSSLSGSEFERGHSLQAIQRYRFYKAKTDLFVELNLGYAQDNFDEFTLFGSSIGLSHKLGSDISIGGFAGADKIIDISGVQPKISTFVSVNL